MVKSGNLVRFDWAMKRLLRDKADYCVVEGLLTVLLERPIHIEGNRLEGRFEGIDEGIVIGEKRGIAMGEERGIAKEKFEIARRLKSMGADLSVIAQATGLSKNEVSKT